MKPKCFFCGIPLAVDREDNPLCDRGRERCDVCDSMLAAVSNPYWIRLQQQDHLRIMSEIVKKQQLLGN
jgi:hypothetical protein